MLKKSLVVLVSGLVLSSAVFAANAPVPNPNCPNPQNCYQYCPNYGQGMGMRGGMMHHRGMHGPRVGGAMGVDPAVGAFCGQGCYGRLGRAHMSGLIYELKDVPEFQKDISNIIGLQDRIFVARQELDSLKMSNADLHLIKDKALALSKLKRQLHFANEALLDKAYTYYNAQRPVQAPAPAPKPVPAPAK